MARMSVWRNPTSAGERPSCEGAVSDDGPEPCRFLPLAPPAANHTGRDGVARSNAEGRAGVTGLWLSPHHAEIATARFRRQLYSRCAGDARGLSVVPAPRLHSLDYGL